MVAFAAPRRVRLVAAGVGGAGVAVSVAARFVGAGIIVALVPGRCVWGLFGKDISAEWDSDPRYQQAFDTLKAELCQYPILRLPDLSKLYCAKQQRSNGRADC